MGKPEGDVERYLCERAEAYGYMCLKFTSPSTDGVPDRILIGHGTTIYVETKAPGEEPRELQNVVIGEMRAHGAEVYVIDTKKGVDALFKRKHPDMNVCSKNEKTRIRGGACRRTAVILAGQDLVGRSPPVKTKEAIPD